jgi:hypothetical protein
MSFYLGQTGVCWWAFGTGSLNQTDWDSYLDHLGKMCVNPSLEPRLRITVSYRQSAPTAAQWRQLAKFVRPYLETLEEKTKLVTAHAFVTDSKLTAGTLAAVSWILKQRKPYPERAFTNPREALVWLSGFSDALLPTEVWAHLRATVPSDLFWPNADSVLSLSA